MWPKPTVVVVEDDPDFAGNIQDILEDNDYEVRICSTGRCALEQVASNAPDLILLDLRLPDADGVDVLVELRQLSADSEVLVITGHGSFHSATSAINAHAFAYLIKPIDFDQLLLMMHRALEGKRAVRALRESEERFRSLTDNSPVGIFQTDSASKCIYANQALLRIYGLSEDECLGDGWQTTVYPPDLEPLKKRIDTATRSASRSEGDYRIIGPDGDLRWLRVISAPLFSEVGKPIGRIGTIMDVTERVQTREALQQSEELHRTLVDTSPDAIVLLDPDGKVLMGNARALGLYGTEDPSEFAGRGVFDLVAPEDQERVTGLLHTLTTNSSAEFELTALRKNGTRSPLEIRASAIRDSSRNVTSIIAMVRDITQRKMAEQALRDSEERFRTLTALSPTGVYMTDAAGHCLYVNERWCEMAGMSEQEALGEGWLDALHPADREQMTKAWNDMVLAGGSWEEEFRFQTPEGKTTWIYTMASSILDANGEILGYMGVDVDITERKKTEAVHELDESRLETLLHLNQITGAPLQEIATYAMEEAVRLTQSDIGYVAIVSEDETMLTMHAWSQAAMKSCRIENKPLHYPVESTGLWGEALRQRKPVITNDYTGPNPGKKGTPDGHVEIVRHMNVPIFDGDRIVVIAGVGNKQTDYDESDVRQLTLLMSGMWRIVQRKQSEQALRNSETLLSQAQRLAKIGSWEYDISTDKHIWSEEMFRVFGLDPATSEPLQGGYGRYLFPDDMEALVSAAKEAVQSGDPLDSELRIIRADGLVAWAHIQCRAIHDEQGNAVRIIGAVQDITQRKRADQALIDSERRYRTLFSEMNEGFALHEIISDFSGKPCDYLFLDVNPAFERLTGLDRNEIVGKTVKEVMPALEPYWIGTYGEAALSGQPVRFESFNRAVGRYFDVFAFCPGPGLFACFVADSTERKVAEGKLRKSEEEYRTLFETMAQGIVYQNASGSITFANPAAERMLGMSLDEMLGRTSMDTIWRTVREDGSELSGECHPPMIALRTGMEVPGTVIGVFNRKERRHRWLSVTAVPQFRPGEDEPYQAYSSFEDITDRKEAEEALRESHERLQTLSRQLVSVQEAERRSIGRELHDQIGGALTALSIALKMNPAQASDNTENNVSLAQELVSDLTTRIREISLDLRPPMLDDLGLVPALLWYFVRYTTQTNVQVDFRHTGAEHRFTQEVETAAFRIIQEALTNAARHAEVPEITVRLFANEKALHLQVEDRGAGFDVDSVLSKCDTNGLTGMQERASLLGGTLVVESSPGAGTSLTATLPLL